MTETPLVVALVQRPGPASGMPSRTEQSDLMLALHGGQGEFPHAVLAPGSPEQACLLTNKAFHLAEKYQIPVVVLSDQYLAESARTYESLNIDELVYEDFRLRGSALKKLDSYRRYELGESPMSPLAVPGDSEHLVVVTANEHDEAGHMTEEGSIRQEMVRKRLQRKMDLLRGEISPPASYGDPEAEILLIGWGSTLGVLQEVVAQLAGKISLRVGLLHFMEVWPFPGSDVFDYVARLRQAERTVCVENNATGQFARLLRSETGFTCSDTVLGYDGRPFDPDFLLREIDALL